MPYESPVPLLSPEVGFKHERVPPPPMAYLTKDDWLAVSVYTTSSTTGLKLAYRFLDSAGQVHYGSESLDGASTSTLTKKVFGLTEGFLLGLSISNLGGGLADAVCFVAAALQRGNQATAPPHTVLTQGYVTNLFSVVWPPTMPRGPATASGSTPAWVLASADATPGTPNPMDDEFSGATLDTTTLWTKETWAAGTTGTLSTSRLTLFTPADASGLIRWISQPIADAAWEFTAQMSCALSEKDYNFAGFVLKDASAAKYVVWGYQRSARNQVIAYYSADGAALTTYLTGGPAGEAARYFRIALASGTLTFSWSPNGVTWVSHATATEATYLPAGTAKVGIGIHNYGQSTNPCALTSDWFRRTA